MALYQRISDNELGLSSHQVQAELGVEVSFVDGADLTEYGFRVYEASARPTVGPGEQLQEIDPIEDDEQWVQQWQVIPASLDTLKAIKNAAVTAKRNAVFDLGFTPSSGPLAGHTLQVRNLEDRTNWLTSQASYSAAVAQGAGAYPGATFRTATNETVVVTFAQGLTVIVQDMAQWGQQIMGRSWVLKDLIDAAEDQTELDAIDIEVGWP